jgi:hypothetical protein
MSPKVAITVLAGALALAPAAYLAFESPVRQHAFSSEGALADQSQRVVRANRPAAAALPAIQLAPVVVTTRRSVRGVVRDALPRTCQPWRSLLTGPGAADAQAPMVRACDAAEMADGSVPPPDSARLAPPPPRPRPAHEQWQYTVDLGASGRAR